jgi:cell division protein FtsN
VRYNNLKNITYKISFQYFITILLISIALTSYYGCSSRNEILSQETIEITFVTKQDASLYNDILDKKIIDEIPAFIKVNALEKIVISTNNNEKVYYKTIFNNKEGWLEAIYLADIKKNNYKKLKPEPAIKLDIPLEKKRKISKVINNKNYYVQIASFQNENNANNLFKDLKLSDVSLSLEKIKSTGGNYFYKLISSGYNNKAKAIEIIREIKKKRPDLKPIIKLANRVNTSPLSKILKKEKRGKTEYYTIQLSSFDNKKAAENLAKKMTNLGYPAKVTEAWVKEKTWFRVQHGEYEMISVAKQVSIKLKNKFKFSPWISNIYK